MKKEISISSLLTAQVKKSPRAIAITSGQREVSYQDLAGAVALFSSRYMTSIPHHQGTVILYLNESVLLATALFSLLGMGLEVIVLNGASDKKMTQHVFDDHAGAWVITERALSSQFSSAGRNILYMDDVLEGPLTGASQEKGAGSIKFYLPEGISVFDLESLMKVFEDLDQHIKAAGRSRFLVSEKVCFQHVLIELLWALTRGLHFIYCTKERKLEEFLSTREAFPMNFSLFYFGSYTGKADESNKYQLLMDSVKHADVHGYSAVWTPERHFNEFGGLFPNPSVMGAALAVMTKNLQIRTGSIVAPLHNSLRIAEDWCVIDNLSNGRAALSFASGWQCDDFAFAPEHYSGRHQQMFKQIGEVRRLWAGESLTVKNGLNKETEVRVFPRPLQPELPIWVTVSGKVDTFIEAGKIGANILTHLLWQDPDELIDKIGAYRSARKENGHDPDTGIVSVMIHTHMGDDNEEVKSIVKKPLKEYMKSSVQLIEAMAKSNALSTREKVGRYGMVEDQTPEHLMEELLEIAFNRFFENAGLLGNPEKCHKLLQKLRMYGVNELACLIDFGLDNATILKGLEVLSRFKESYSSRQIEKYDIAFIHGESEELQSLSKEMSESSLPSLGSSDQNRETIHPFLKKMIFSRNSSDEVTNLSSNDLLLKLVYDFGQKDLSLKADDQIHYSPEEFNHLEEINSKIEEEF